MKFLSVFKLLRAKWGGNTISVNLRVKNVPFARSSEVTGTIELIGGSITQNIDAIFLHLMSEGKGKQTFHGDYKVHGPLVLKQHAPLSIPFSVILPDDAPLTHPHQLVYFMTDIIIPFGINVRDKDYIKIIDQTLLENPPLHSLDNQKT